MTETCAGSIYSNDFPDLDAGNEFASVGLPIRELQMRVTNEKKEILAEGEIGELQLRGPMIFSHYYNNEAATKSAFTTDGWFRTGDLGCIKSGRLTLVGRNKDSIIVNGVNYFSQEIEATLEQLAGIDPSFVAAFPTRTQGDNTESLVISFSVTFPFDDVGRLYSVIVAVRTTVLMLWGFRPALTLPLPREEFPKTSLGKIQRTLLRQRLESGALNSHIERIAEVMERQLGGHVSPFGAVERAVAEIFGELFVIRPSEISATTDFFDLGGTSLEILKLTRILAQRFGVETTLTTVLQYPTPRALASHISSGRIRVGQTYDPIVPLQHSGTGTPLFCIHPGNGGVLTYINLAKYFANDRPFLALQPRGFNHDEACFETFDAMVSTYHAAIRQRQPRGPYALAGYSLGGNIAFEIAKLLEMQGERVSFLGCIDIYPWEGEPLIDFARTAILLAALLQLVEWSDLDAIETMLRSETVDRDPCEFILRIASSERLAQLELDLSKFTAWARVAHSMKTVSAPYVARGSVQAMTVLYSDGLFGSSAEWFDQIKRWDRFVRQPRYVKVPGRHFTLMAPEHVTGFQAILRAEVDRAQTGYTA
jgi:thioesterase domain-containing protein/acyl carrier protein